MHDEAGRDQNLLSFETQHELAQQGFMKFGAPAEFMREYFRNARGIHNEMWRALDLLKGARARCSTIFETAGRVSPNEGLTA
ncbi:MAG TPA: hypothetical protein VF146_15500 [Bryobacteraceae bacterium]